MRGVEADAELLALVREHVVAVLPGYMVPASLGVLDAVPLSVNGKVDRSSLPEPGTTPTERGDDPPRTPQEQLVAAHVGRLLGRPQVPVHANFFELGLDSVLVLRLHRELRVALGREFPITSLFEHPTVHRLAEFLAGTDDGDQALAAAFARGQRSRQSRRRPGRREVERDGRGHERDRREQEQEMPR